MRRLDDTERKTPVPLTTRDTRILAHMWRRSYTGYRAFRIHRLFSEEMHKGYTAVPSGYRNRGVQG